MTDIEEALALLAAPCTDARFFQRALKALSLVCQCRWAAFACPSTEQADRINLIAMCDNKQALPLIKYSSIGSPCRLFYQNNKQNHLFIQKHLSKRYPDFELLKSIVAESYQGELIKDENHHPVGHIMVLDPFPQSESIKSREFFRLVAQRIGTEFRRLSSKQKSFALNRPMTTSRELKYIYDATNLNGKIASLTIKINNFSSLSSSLDNECMNLLFNIIEERLSNNLYKQDVILLNGDDKIHILVTGDPDSTAQEILQQLTSMGNRIITVLGNQIEIKHQLITLSLGYQTRLFTPDELQSQLVNQLNNPKALKGNE